MAIIAEGSRSLTVLDGMDTFRIMRVEGDVSVTLQGLEFTNGYENDGTALLVWNQADVIINDCSFVENYATGSNAVHVRHTGTSASFFNCDFLRNECAVHSAALSLGSGFLLVEDCLFADNISHGVAGAVNCNAGQVDFHGNVFLRNRGEGEGALVIQGSTTGIVSGNTFHDNFGSSYGGSVSINYATTFFQNIVTGTQGGPGLVSGSAALRSCNLYYDNDGGSILGSVIGDSEFVADPMYCDAFSDFLTLCSFSPASGNNNGCGTIGAFGVGCSQCGVVAVEPMTLDGVKSLYR